MKAWILEYLKSHKAVVVSFVLGMIAGGVVFNLHRIFR